MLRISHSQIASLARAGEDRFVASEVARLAIQAQTNHPDRAAPDENWVIGNLEFGKAYGLYSEDDHARFNDLRLAEIDTFPTADDMEILQNEDLWGWEKLDALEGSRIIAQKSSLET